MTPWRRLAGRSRLGAPQRLDSLQRGLVVGLGSDRFDVHARHSFKGSDRLRVDRVVLPVRADEADVDHPLRVVDPDDQPVLVASQVEHHPPVFQDAGRAELGLYRGRRGPVGLQHVAIPGQGRLLRVLVRRAVGPERLQAGVGPELVGGGP